MHELLDKVWIDLEASLLKGSGLTSVSLPDDCPNDYALAAYVDLGVASESFSEVEAHLRYCAHCRVAVQLVSESWHDVQNESYDSGSTDVVGRIEQGVITTVGAPIGNGAIRTNLSHKTLHIGGIIYMAISSSGNQILTVGRENTSELREFDTGRLVNGAEFDDREISSCALAPSDRLLAVGLRCGLIRLIDVAEGQLQRVLKEHDGSVEAIAWSANGRYLASCARDNVVVVWDPGRGCAKRQVQQGAHDSAWGTIYARCLSWHPADDELLAIGTDEGRIELFRMDDSGEPWVIKEHSEAITAISWSPEGEVLAAASADCVISIYESNGRLCRTLVASGTAVVGIVFSTSYKLMAGITSDGTVDVWHTSSWERVGSTQLPPRVASYSGRCVVFAARTPSLVIPGEHLAVHVVDIANAAVRKKDHGCITATAS